ncbi:MAG: bifunctional folylpolyglutamate synthase/dihydrofolate synthase [Lachnospiraceae bacterium]|nr:bifunctional folylpolyglutamate synthase/dihydrofolate synthase [Lachnospiraceae bacterium]
MNYSKMKRTNILNYNDAVAYLLDMPRFTSKNTIEDTRRFLARMNNPEKNLHIIHVAGTNGKGSVCSYIRFILEEAGYSVSVFTSPHLVDIRERFVTGGEPVSEEDFFRAFMQIYNMLDWEALSRDEGYHPTFFEYLFFMAMLIFSDAETDFCILETGLGGRLDATNSVTKKDLSVITRIGLDHTQYLGDTVEKIAAEKAGIMMRGVPVVYTDSSPAASEVFERRLSELGIKGYSVSKKDYAFLNFRNKSIDFSLHTRYYGYVGLNIATIAHYQMENAALAVRAVEVLDEGRTVSKEAIVRGTARAFWQGRMEEVLPEIYVDGAHNEDGIRAFLDTVGHDGILNGRSLIFGAVADKDIRHMIESIVQSGLFDKIAVVRLKTGRTADMNMLAGIFKECGFAGCIPYESADKALGGLIDGRRSGERIYIAGSLYLVGEIKEFLIND